MPAEMRNFCDIYMFLKIVYFANSSKRSPTFEFCLTVGTPKVIHVSYYTINNKKA